MITVVSGLPRSGTSLMMQMLAAGGMEVLTDGQRSPDADNPQGYYELERIKRLKEDSSWLADADGKAIKVVSTLLYDLPLDYQYRVIFMKRRMDEVLASQRKMLQRLKANDGQVSDAQMRIYFATHLERLEKWLPTVARLAVSYCDYNELVQKPADVAEQVARFLDCQMDVERMASLVDATLYRNRQAR